MSLTKEQKNEVFDFIARKDAWLDLAFELDVPEEYESDKEIFNFLMSRFAIYKLFETTLKFCTAEGVSYNPYDEFSPHVARYLKTMLGDDAVD